MSRTVTSGCNWPVNDLWQRASTGRFPFTQLNLGLFGYLKRVVNVNSEVTDSAFQLAVTE